VLCDTLRQYASVPYALSSLGEPEKTASEIEALGRRVIVGYADVTDLDAMLQLATRAQEELGPIDIVIANAGLYSFGPTWELTEQQWDETLAVVLKGAWITCKVAIPHMIARRRGKIICSKPMHDNHTRSFRTQAEQKMRRLVNLIAALNEALFQERSIRTITIDNEKVSYPDYSFLNRYLYLRDFTALHVLLKRLRREILYYRPYR
jgi:NAD(P)-dependent dehydrogenase (short-subunit alcohol dehydrogenase family)